RADELAELAHVPEYRPVAALTQCVVPPTDGGECGLGARIVVGWQGEEIDPEAALETGARARGFGRGTLELPQPQGDRREVGRLQPGGLRSRIAGQERGERDEVLEVGKAPRSGHADRARELPAGRDRLP